MANPWRYWWPQRGEDIADARDYPAGPLRDPEGVAESVSERDWARGEYWTEETIALVDPHGTQRIYEITVESVPRFAFREKVTLHKGDARRSDNEGKGNG